MDWRNGESLHGESIGIIFLIFAGVIANLPVLIVYTRSKHIRSITDKFLLNLLIADIVALILLLPSILISFIHYSSLANEHNNLSSSDSHAEESIPGASLNYFNTTFETTQTSSQFASDGLLQTFYWKWSCTINKALISGVATASVLAALEIALERYLAVVTPLHYHKLLTTPSISFVSASGGLISLASFLISAFDPSQFQFPACNLSRSKRSVGSPVFQSSFINHTFTETHNKLEDAFHSSRNSDDEPNPFVEYDEDSPFKTIEDSLKDSGTMSMKHTEQLIWAIFNLIHIFLVFILPVILMSYIYVRIFLEARRQKIRMTQRYKPYFLPGNPNQLNPFDSSAAEFKGKASRFDPIFVRFRLMDRFRPPRLDRALRVAVFAVVVSVLCWTPYYIVRGTNAIKTILAVSGSRVSLNPHEANEDEETQLLLSLGRRQSPVLSNEVTKWNSVYPLLFASLHPLLASVFYAYRYKRLRLEILRVICDTFSICGRHDQRATSSSCATTSSHLHTGRLSSGSTTCGGSPCIRQTIAIPEGVCHVTSGSVNKSPSEANGTLLSSTNSLGSERDVPQIIVSSGDSSPGVQPLPESSQTKHSSISIRIDSVEADESPRDLICLPCEQRGECHLGMRRVEIPNDGSSGEGVVRMERSMGTFVNCLTVWMNSYSRRWLQHRESVTSTASFITLLSSKYHNKAHPVSNV